MLNPDKSSPIKNSGWESGNNPYNPDWSINSKTKMNIKKNHYTPSNAGILIVTMLLVW